MSAAKINRPRRVSLAGLMVALLLAAAATLGSHCPAGAVETATPLATAGVDGHAAHRGGSAPMAHRLVADQSARNAGAVAISDGRVGQAARVGGVAVVADGRVVAQTADAGSADVVADGRVVAQAADARGMAVMADRRVVAQTADAGSAAVVADRRVVGQAGQARGMAGMDASAVGRAAQRGGAAVVAGTRATHAGDGVAMAHHPIAEPGIHPGSPVESGSRGLIALCVSVAVAVLLAMVRLGQPNAVEVRAPVGRLPAALRRLAWPSPDPVRLCVLRT